MSDFPPNIKNYRPIICSRCNRLRKELIGCNDNQYGCDFEKYRDAIIRRFHNGPPQKIFITLTGGVNSGKTYYLLVLIDLMLNDDPTKLHLKKFGIDDVFLADPITKETFNGFLNECIAGKLMLTVPNKLTFFNVFIRLYNGRIYELVLFNTSGEKIEDIFLADDEYTSAHELKGAAVLHFVDPREDSNLNSILKNPKDPSFGVCKDYNISDFTHSILQVVNRGKRIVDNPVAICISKFDLLMHKIPYELPENPYIDLLYDLSGNSFFSEIDQKSISLSQFLSNKSSTIKPSRLQSKYSVLNYFALAPFGSDKYPAYWQDKTPKGILAPFLWIINELKILPNDNGSF
jgi:hypothetical protein